MNKTNNKMITTINKTNIMTKEKKHLEKQITNTIYNQKKTVKLHQVQKTNIKEIFNKFTMNGNNQDMVEVLKNQLSHKDHQDISSTQMIIQYLLKKSHKN